MSDLTATNCGCGCDNDDRRGNGRSLFGGDCCSIVWALILLSLFCGNGSGFGFGRNGDDNGCCMILLLLLFCGGFDNGCSIF